MVLQRQRRGFLCRERVQVQVQIQKRANKEFSDIVNANDCDSRIIKGNLNEKEAFDLEQEVIKNYRKTGQPLINVQDGGHMPPSSKGKKRTIETRVKLSSSLKTYYKEHPEKCKELSEKFTNFLSTEEGKEFQKK